MLETHQLTCRRLKIRPKLDYIKWIKLPGLQTLIDFAITVKLGIPIPNKTINKYANSSIEKLILKRNHI